MMKGKYRITAYHCPSCGGTTDPVKGNCQYCESKILLRKFQGELQKRKIRIMVDCGEDYIYFDRIMNIQQSIFYDDLQSYRDINGNLHRKTSKQRGKTDVDIILDNRGIELLRKIKLGEIYNTRIEFLAMDKAIETKTYIPDFRFDNMEIDTIATANLSFISAGETEIFNRLVPDNAKCPNCGAPVKSKYGCCDWCGGWLEYEW